MRGGRFDREKSLPSMGGAWKLASAGDLNGDGVTDLVWRHSNLGSNLVWLMRNGARLESIPLPNTTNLVPLAAGDYDGDGDDDLLLKNTGTRRTVIWKIAKGEFQKQLVTKDAPATNGKAVFRDVDRDGVDEVVWDYGSDGVKRWELYSGGSVKSDVKLPLAPGGGVLLAP